MKFLILTFMLFTKVGNSDALREGQDYATAATTVDIERLKHSDKAIAETGIAVTKAPQEAALKDDGALHAAAQSAKETDDLFKDIKKNFVERPFEAAPEAPEEALESTTTKQTTIQKCYRSGDGYTRTCVKHRVVELKLTPQIGHRTARYCPGHRWWWQRHEEGCKGGEYVIDQHRKVEVIKDEWIGCEDLEEMFSKDKANLVHEELIGRDEKRTLKAYTADKTKSEDETISRDAWEIRRTYSLKPDFIDTCKPLMLMGCADKGGICVDEVSTPEGIRVCRKFEHTFQCFHESHGTKVTFTDKIPIAAPSKVPNARMFEALSKLQGLSEMSKQMEGQPVASVFKGQDGRCTTNFGGSFKDCCQDDGGFGTSIGLARDCTADEQNLKVWKSQKRCVFVGSRRKNDTFGINWSSEKVYCCFPSPIARAIQQQGRAQLGIGWGSAESPNCRGLTPDELKRIDFNKIDLSEAYAEIAEKVAKNTKSVVDGFNAKQSQLKSEAAKESLKLEQQTLTKESRESY